MGDIEPDRNRAGKAVGRLTSQRQTLEMARFLGKREIGRGETLVGILSAIIIYGVGAGFLGYLLYLASR